MRRWMLGLMLGLLLTVSAAAQDEEPVTMRENAPDAAGLTLTLVANDFFRPIYVTGAGDDSNRLFIVEQNGRIWIMQDGQILPDPFLDIVDRVSQSSTRGYSELGLLGLAFDPDFAENSTFYVHYNDREMTSTISQFTVGDDADHADDSSEQILLTLRQPYSNHNGGDIVFGPDGYLYIAFGDGGDQGDPHDSGQDPSDWFASILRIDVDGQGGYSIPDTNPYNTDSTFGQEVWSYGFRNPWKFSFDRATGDMYIADVGQNAWEELDFEAAGSPGGANYGWSAFEGSHPYKVNDAPANMVYPFYEYRHEDGRCSVTGGYVYRGAAIPDLTGAYIFGDYCTGEVWAAWRDLDGVWQTESLFTPGFNISSFGEDKAGEIYVVNHDGEIYRIDPA